MKLGSTERRWLILIFVLSLVGNVVSQPDPIHAQSIPSSFLTVTYDNSSQMSSIWSISRKNLTATKLKSIALNSGLNPKDTLPNVEQELLAAASKREPALKDLASRPLSQIYLGAWWADAETIIIQQLKSLCYNVDTEYCFGFYEFSVLRLSTGVENRIIQIPLHNNFEKAMSGCQANLQTRIHNIRINTNQRKMALTLSPEQPCSGVVQHPSRTFIVDYAQPSLGVQTLEMVDGVSWSPDGNSLAYIRMICDQKICSGTVEIQQIRTGARITVANASEVPHNWPSVTAWINNTTMIYQWFGYSQKTESGVGLQLYDTTQSDISFYPYESLFGSNSLYSISNSKVDFIGKSTQGEVLQIRLAVDAARIEETKANLESLIHDNVTLSSEILISWEGWAKIFPENESITYISSSPN
jgi:hypothetical protein